MDGQHQRLVGVGIADVVADSITQLPQCQALPNDLGFQIWLKPFAHSRSKGLRSCTYSPSPSCFG